MKIALILGINGQDGSFLAEILLEKGYEVHGLVRRTAKDNLQNINHIINKVNLHYGDLNDPVSIQKIINISKPVEIYNEADQDHAGISFDIPSYNYDVTGSAVGRILEIIKNTDFAELCITSKATILYKENIEIDVKTIKAKGTKCPVCWKISQESCVRHPE